MASAEQINDADDLRHIGVPSPYQELVHVLEILPDLVREKRRREGLSVRAAAEQVPGVSFSTLARFENRAGAHVDNAMALLRWVGEVPTDGGDL